MRGIKQFTTAAACKYVYIKLTLVKAPIKIKTEHRR